MKTTLLLCFVSSFVGALIAVSIVHSHVFDDQVDAAAVAQTEPQQNPAVLTAPGGMAIQDPRDIAKPNWTEIRKFSEEEQTNIDVYENVNRSVVNIDTKINREDFGLTWNMAVEGGGVLVGKEIKISLAVEAALVEEAALA